MERNAIFNTFLSINPTETSGTFTNYSRMYPDEHMVINSRENIEKELHLGGITGLIKYMNLY